MSNDEVLRLNRSGLPLYLDMSSGIMALSGELTFRGMGHKRAADMEGLFVAGQSVEHDKPIYEIYRGIAFPKDDGIFERYEMSYDITIIRGGTVGGEFHKTSGHYHGWNPSRTNTYGEVYEVIFGEALFVLQKSPDFDENPAGTHVEDVILARVHAGQTLLVPPNYGHCSVNVGEGPLVFSNVAYKPCPVIYDSVKMHHGMAYYAFKGEDGEIEIRKNDNYSNLPEPRLVGVREDPELGIDFLRGAYENFVEAPGLFNFLPHPDGYIARIMSLLVDE